MKIKIKIDNIEIEVDEGSNSKTFIGVYESHNKHIQSTIKTMVEECIKLYGLKK